MIFDPSCGVYKTPKEVLKYIKQQKRKILFNKFLSRLKRTEKPIGIKLRSGL